MTHARLAIGLVLLLAAPIRAADVADVARLFPPGTLAYVELYDPAAVAPELAAVVKGSKLEDSLRYIHERRDKTKQMRDLMVPDEFAFLGLLTAPEIAGELGKVRGAAVALTGFNERNEPDIAFAVLTGESHALGLAARAYLTISPRVRKIGVVSGVPVFQIRQAFVQYGQNGQPLPANEKPVEEGFAQATFAYTPGLFVVGSSRAVVGNVIAQFQDSAKKSLADEPVFQAAAAKNRKAGLYWYATPRELCNRIDAANKVNGELIDQDAYAYLKMIADIKAVRSASGTLRFRDKGLAVTADLALEPDAKSPLLAMLDGQASDANSLKFLPGDATLGLSIALPNKDRAAATLGFLDAIAKANGALGRMPGQAASEIGAKFKIAIADELLAKTRTVTIVLPTRQELPQGSLTLPTLVFHTETAAAAGGWADGVRAIAGDLSGASSLPQPSTETVDGVKVYSLPATGLPTKAPVHYASEGTVFVVGLDRKVVAASVKGRASPPSIPPGVDVKSAAAVGLFSPGGLVRMSLSSTKAEAAVEGPKIVDGPEVAPRRIGKPQRMASNGQPVDPELIKQEAAAFEEMMTALAAMPPAFGTIRRTPAEVRIEWFFPELQAPPMAKAIDSVVGWLERTVAASGRDMNDRQPILLPQ